MILGQSFRVAYTFISSAPRYVLYPSLHSCESYRDRILDLKDSERYMIELQSVIHNDSSCADFINYVQDRPRVKRALESLRELAEEYSMANWARLL